LRPSRLIRRIHRVAIEDDALPLLERMAPEGGTLIPFTDEFLILTSRHHETLSQHFEVAAPPWSILKPVIDQREAYRIAREIGLNTPEFFVPQSEAEMRETVTSLDLENHSYLLKTFLEAGPANLELSRYTLLAGTNRQQIIDNCLAIHGRNGEFPMIARVIPGGAEDCYGVVALVGHDHKPAFAYTVRRLKLFKPSHGGLPGGEFTVGANAFCETVDDPEAVEATARLVERCKFTGPIVMEFRRDARDGRLILVKPDPRMTIATGLSHALGVDLPMQTYRLFNHLPLAPAPAVKPGVRWLWLAGYIDALWESRKHQPMHRELARLTARLAGVRSLGFWNPRDPFPFVLDTGAVFVKRFLRSIGRLKARPVVRPS
jgi:predicted ATP-grasp superfamily ATP-dependent carboligase